eukprot:SAG22_NODE_8872_length_625_cov_0.866920_2_plen_29_part_01
MQVAPMDQISQKATHSNSMAVILAYWVIY